MKDRVEKISAKISYILDKYNLLFLLMIFLVFLFSRLYMLGVIPAGIHYDGVSMAFDAKTLAKYGMDRWGNRFPFYLPAFGDGQSPLYTYTMALLIRFVPFSMVVMRLPAVIYGCVCFFSMYFLVRDAFEDKRWALMGPVLVTIIPYFFTSERWALDCNLFLSLAPLAFYMLFRAIRDDKKLTWFLSGLAIGITLYTYVLSYVVIPVFLALALIYVIAIKRFSFKGWLIMAIPVFVLALPLLLMQLISMGLIEPFSFLIFDFPRLYYYRSGEISLSHIPGNLWYLWGILVHGKSFTFTSIPKFGPIYVVMIPFVAAGFAISVINTVKAIRTKSFAVEPLMLAFTIGGYFMMMMTSGDLNIYNGNELFIMFAMYIIICMKWLHDKAKLITPAVLLVFAAYFLSFSNYYFRHYNAEFGLQFMFISTEHMDVVNYVNNNLNPGHKKIYYMYDVHQLLYEDTVIGCALAPDPRNWRKDLDEKNMINNVYIGTPAEGFDMDEDCIYIMARDGNGHIIPYFIEDGWTYDESFPSYTILYR